jgi:drug/metabolite transporter (DMT)-like permease
MSNQAVTAAPIHTYVLLAAGLAMFAFAPIMVRLAGPTADPVAITTIRTISAFLMLLPFWIVKQLRKDVPKIHRTRKELMWTALAGFSLAAHFTLWIGSLFYTSIASASVLVTIHPIMLILVESTFLKKKFPVLSWIGVIGAFTGSVLLGVFDSGPSDHFTNPLLGNSMAMVASVFFVCYILISQKIRVTSSWLDYVFAVYGFTAIGTIIIALILGTSFHQPTETILSGIALAVGASIIGHGSMNYAVKFISATLLSTLILAEPVFATLLGVAVFGEIPAMSSIIAMGVIMVGIFLTWWGRRGPSSKTNSD